MRSSVSRILAVLVASAIGCGHEPASTVGDSEPADTSVHEPEDTAALDTAALDSSSALDGDAGCGAMAVLVYAEAGCDGSVVPVCRPKDDAACLTVVCGCDGKVHDGSCNKVLVPFAFGYSTPDPPAPGTPCGDGGV